MCPSCESKRIVLGQIFTNIFINRLPEFKPNERKLFTTSPGYINLNRDVSLCVDCGRVWTSTDPTYARKKLKDLLKKEALKELGLDS